MNVASSLAQTAAAVGNVAVKAKDSAVTKATEAFNALANRVDTTSPSYKQGFKDGQKGLVSRTTTVLACAAASAVSVAVTMAAMGAFDDNC